MGNPKESAQPQSQAKSAVPSRVSELLLLFLLMILIGCIRVYYGGAHNLMIVWKGEFAYHDTLVNLDELLAQPRSQIAQTHPAVLWQLEEMGILPPEDDVRQGRRSPVRYQESTTLQEIDNNNGGRPGIQ